MTFYYNTALGVEVEAFRTCEGTHAVWPAWAFEHFGQGTFNFTATGLIKVTLHDGREEIADPISYIMRDGDKRIHVVNVALFRSFFTKGRLVQPVSSEQLVKALAASAQVDTMAMRHRCTVERSYVLDGPVNVNKEGPVDLSQMQGGSEEALRAAMEGLEEALTRSHALLREVEWSAVGVVRGGFGVVRDTCPVCRATKARGHVKECRLKEALS